MLGVVIGEGPSGLTDQRVRALRTAREIVAELRWDGLAVPSVYGTMADEFDELVRDGRYGAWLHDGHRGDDGRRRQGAPGRSS